jgi:hypothetical protein
MYGGDVHLAGRGEMILNVHSIAKSIPTLSIISDPARAKALGTVVPPIAQ